MVLYYDGPDARVTDTVIEVWRPYHQRFPVHDLYDVCYCVGGVDRATARSQYAFGFTLGAVSASWPFLHTTMDWMAATFAVTVSGVVTRTCARMRPPELALRARYRGLQVELYASTDPRVFGQVRRALVRSLERHGR